MADEKKKKETPAEGAAANYEPKPDGASVAAANAAAYASILIPDDDYEARFMKDAIQRAHDRELAALASLALIRSERDERRMLLAELELEQAMSPREVNRRLRAAEEEEQSKPKKKGGGGTGG